MNETVLTSEEKKELEKRGFYVKENISINILIRNIPFQIMLLTSFSQIGFIIGAVITFSGYEAENILLNSMFFTTAPVLLYIINKSLIRYIFLGKTFYNGSYAVIFPYGNRLLRNKDSYLREIVKNIQSDSSSMKTMIHTSERGNIFLLPIFLLMMIFSISQYPGIENIKESDLLTNFVLPILAVFGLLYLVAGIFHNLIVHLHPLYAFGNLGEKIQKLTPEIEEKSKVIQKNFQKDMNFRVLSDVFDSLATTSSEIVNLVINLEKVEKRANKGNLFDSEKYVNSLRSDIVGPLRSLKVFLKKQKEDLVVSRKALTNIGALDPSLHSGGQQVRVRVGGEVDSGSSPEGQGNTELASKRSESLLLELTENIDKLDSMIEKMG